MLKRVCLLIITLIIGLISTRAAQAQGPITPYHTDPAWQAWYWNNPHLSGPPALQRSEAELNHTWGHGSPDSSIHSDRFSARWTRYIDVPPGLYRFTATSDDGIRVWVDGELIIEEWYDHGVLTVGANRRLGAGHHLVVVEYYENGGEAAARLAFGPAEQAIRNWRGEYFNNSNFSGAPVLVRDDEKVNFDWGSGSPAPGRLGVDSFSVRWTRSLNLPAGSYRFSMTTDDGGRLWVNNHLLIDAWRVQAPTMSTGDIYLPGGSVPIKMEYFENNGGAVARLRWNQAHSPNPPLPPPAAGWFGEYYTNRDLSGGAVMARIDPELHFDWGTGAPAQGFPADNFSVRWTRDIYFERGEYEVFIRHDDGARVWVDDALIIDAWYDQGATTHSRSLSLSRGTHRFRVEYYEHGDKASVRSWITPKHWTDSEFPSEVVVENSDPGFEWGGPARGRKTAWLNARNEVYWTYNSTTDPVNSGKWTVNLPVAGRYEVLVYIPEDYGSSTNARYRILHNGQRHDQVINQGAYRNQWVSLGTYSFSGWSPDQEAVVLYDNTGEAYTSRTLVFDAVKFVRR